MAFSQRVIQRGISVVQRNALQNNVGQWLAKRIKIPLPLVTPQQQCEAAPGPNTHLPPISNGKHTLALAPRHN